VTFISGDVDGNGSVNATDVQTVCGGMRQGSDAFDYDRDGTLGMSDLDYYVRRIIGTTFGDANLDRRFDSGDLTRVWQAGEYEDQVAGNSTWAEGDWNCNGDFGTSDIVMAFVYGRYEQVAASAISVSRSDVTAAIDSWPTLGNRLGRYGHHSVANPSGDQRTLSPSRVDSVFAAHRRPMEQPVAIQRSERQGSPPRSPERLPQHDDTGELGYATSEDFPLMGETT
jgi:hypothetical protein